MGLITAKGLSGSLIELKMTALGVLDLGEYLQISNKRPKHRFFGGPILVSATKGPNDGSNSSVANDGHLK